MISLGAICQNIMYIDDATAVLTEHSTYTWNKAGTRIRCNGDTCGTILEAPDGPAGVGAVSVFARHQAEQLPKPAITETADTAGEESEASDTTASEARGDDPELAESVSDGPEHTTEHEPAGDTMEQALSEAAIARADDQTAPKVRRDTKALTATIAEIKKGDRVSAGFNHPRYGFFTIEGTVIKGGTGLDRNQLMVGGWYINLNERAAKYLHELAILAPAGKHDFVIPKPSELTEHVGIGS
ncbi:hypothetical protein Achl_4271 (plasmid) [Pseudarthrobacter chlorophenolicus A6]|uniref:Uncharacterized protein n=1 Tax=Pseudarthrobacter chlorophenolicus (strain ATCC 700700 / DSM 12829 / CIP 107037 / JCM 12360 / KCTC 9906 / NCIMB 13794 / A6) TaxID=452863 RepID=B8HIH5_PSECP|nr:hypothetical protein [Pseudarthrobacter chlorophenolicus]ACL42222.1 hypothetical protein Achl_4271 [Pseudarthrobacter chlorophenolicus A6]SDQ15095.1 hypothetical protein SAMN04489738_0329 [Pseudarthrobacter chlorophenolicus]